MLILERRCPKEELMSHLEQKRIPTKEGVKILSSTRMTVQSEIQECTGLSRNDVIINGTCLLNGGPTLHVNSGCEENYFSALITENDTNPKSSVLQTSVPVSLSHFHIGDGLTDQAGNSSVGLEFKSIEQMGPESVSSVIESSTMQSVPDLISSSSSLVPVACEKNPESTSTASKIVGGDLQQGHRQLFTVDSTVGNGDSKDILAIKAKDLGEPEDSKINVLPGVSTNPNSAEDDVTDVKVCDICGDIGYEEVLVICSECNEGAEHIYCMQTHLEAVPEGDWFCDECKLKHKANEQKKAVTESDVQASKSPSLSRSTGNQSSDGNIVSKLSSSDKLKTSSEKVKTQKPVQSSMVPCKRQIEDSTGVPDSKKQAIEGSNEVVNALGSSVQRGNLLKVQETTNADGCGASQQIRSPVRPLYARDGSFKLPECGKTESVVLASPVCSNSMVRSLSRENSFKTVETAKVKFLPSTTSVGPSSGITLRASAKPTGVDGKPAATSPRAGMGNSGLSSSRRSTMPMMDSAGVSINRSGFQSPLRQGPVNSMLKRAGISKSGDALPSFLLSTRSNNSSRGHFANKSNKEIRSGNGQLVGQSSELRTPTGQNTKLSKTTSCIPTDLKQWKDTQIILPGNAEMKGITGPSAGKCLVGDSIGEKSDGHPSSVPSISTSENCRSEETMALVKEDLHLTSASAHHSSKVLGGDSKVPVLTATAKENRNGLTMTKGYMKDVVSAVCPKVLESAKEDTNGLTPRSFEAKACTSSRKEEVKYVPASSLDRDDLKGLADIKEDFMDLSLRGEGLTRVSLVKEDTAGLASTKGTLSKEGMAGPFLLDDSLSTGKEDLKAQGSTKNEHEMAVLVDVDQKLPVSRKEVSLGTTEKQIIVEDVGKASANLSLDRDVISPFIESQPGPDSSSFAQLQLGQGNMAVANNSANGENDIILSRKATAVTGISSNVALVETGSGTVKSSSSASAVNIISRETSRISNSLSSSSLLDTPVQSVALAGSRKCYRCKEFGHSAQACSKSASFNKDIVRLTSSRSSIPVTCAVIDNVNKSNAQETDQISRGKFPEVQCLSNAPPGGSSTLHENDLSAGLKSTIEALKYNSSVVGASQATAKPYSCYADMASSSTSAASQTSVVSEAVHGSNNSSIQRKWISQMVDRGISDSNPCTLNEATIKCANGHFRDSTPIQGAFGTEESVGAQIGNKALDRWERPSLSGNLFSMAKIAAGASQQCTFGFPPQKRPTLPEPQFLWRGGFEIIDKVGCYHFYDGMQAHPSNRASPKVHEVSRKFPSQLHLEQVQRCDSWPKRFQESPPTDEDIALYIFPADIERCQMPYIELLKDTIKHDLAMRVNLESAELLIFSSNQLPENYHRFNGWMYLWGVFRGGKKTPSIQNSKEALPLGTDIGANVLQAGPSAQLTRHMEDPLTRQLACADISEVNRGEEDMDIDMEGGREIDTSERPATRPGSQIDFVSVTHTSEPSSPLDSKPVSSHYESGKLAGPFEREGPSLVVSRTSYVKAIDNTDQHASPYGSNKELDFPPGFDPHLGFHRSLSKSSTNSGKCLESMLEDNNLLGVHGRPQERELPSGLGLPKSGRDFPDKNVSSGFKSQGPNCLPGIGLEHPYIPLGFESVAAGKPPLLSSDHSLEHLVSKHLADKHNLEPEDQNEMQPSSRHSMCLLSRNESSTKSHSRSRGLSRSRSLTPVYREADRTGGAPQMCKSRSFREQTSFTRISRIEKEDKRERGAEGSREKEDKRERGRHGSREREDKKGWGSNNSIEKEDNRGRARNNSIEGKYKRERARNSSREKEEERERGRNSREKEDKRESVRKYREPEKKERDWDRGSHRHRSRYSGITRRNEHGKHYHTSAHHHSHSESPTQSCSPSGGKCRSHGAGNLTHDQISSSDTGSSDRHLRNKRPSLERDSESEGRFEIVSFPHKGKAQMEDDYGRSCKREKSSGKIMGPQHCSLEVKEECGIIRSGEISADQDKKTKHQWSFTPLHDLNDAVDIKISDALNSTSLEQYSEQKYSREISPQEHVQSDVSDHMNLRSNPVSNSGLSDWSLMLEGNWCVGSRLAVPKSVTCLQLFPVEDGNCREGEVIVNDCDFNLELELGRQTSNKLPLSLFDQPLAKTHSCNFTVSHGAGPSSSKLGCDDSREANSAGLASMLSLSIPQYRKEGNTWVEVVEDREMLDEQDVDVKLTL